MEDKHLQLKHRLAFGAVISAFFCFTLGAFGPLRLYVSGNDEMWFSFRSLLTPVIVVTLIGFVLGAAILALPPGTIHKVLCCLAFGVALGFYIQCGFFNISYGSGVLDGSQIAWKDYTTYGAIDSAMWAACIALPFALYMVFKRSWRHILMVAAAFILVLQIGGLAINIYQNQSSLEKLSHEVTSEGAYELTAEDNTLVFVMSSMDSVLYQGYLEKNPEVVRELEGFTEYENALSTGSGTMVSFPSLLTGEVYKKDLRYTDYIENMWKRDSVFDLMSKSGADVRIYCDDMYFGNAAVRKIDNVVDRAQDGESYRVLTRMMYKYTLYNSMPHYLKRFFWMNLGSYSRNYKSNITYTAYGDDKLFADYDENGGFGYTLDSKSAVRIYHLQGAKAPYRLDAEGKRNKSATTRAEQIQGEFRYILKMIGDLKQNGKYENARIIITADNGVQDMGQHAMLLFKDKGETEGYAISDAPVTLFDLPATLASAYTDNYSGFGSGRTFKDAENASRSRRRYFYYSTGTNAESRVDEYVSTPSPDAENGLRLLHSYYINGGRIENYTLGTQLTFASDETAAIYCKSGFDQTNGWRTIMRGPTAVMEIPFADIPENIQDLHAYFDVLNIYEETRCVIRANGRAVFNGRLNAVIRQNGLNFLIPRDLIGSDKLLTLEFSFPDLPDSKNIMALTSFKIYRQ